MKSIGDTGASTVAAAAALEETGDEASTGPPPKPDYPALCVGVEGNSLDDIKVQWLRYNHIQNPRKDVITMVSDAKKSIWKSICACVKGVKTIKDWNQNDICKAHVFVSKSIIKSLDLIHTCTDEHVGRRRNYNANQLHMASQELLRSIPTNSKGDRRSEAAQEYMEAAAKEGFSMGKMQAYKVVFRLSRQPIEAQIGEFYYMSSLFKAWKRADPDGSYTLEKAPCAWKLQQPPVEQFQRYYIAPSTSKHAWRHSRMHLFMSDASNTSTSWSSFQMSLMMAVTLDGNNDVVVLALALCNSDNELNWIWFLQNLMRDFSKINTFLSSSEHVANGHIPSLLELMNAAPSRCVESVIVSLEKSLSVEMTPDEKEQIRKLARSTSAQAYDAQMRTITEHDPDVAAYLEKRKQQFVSHWLLESSQEQQDPDQEQSLSIKRQRFGEIASRASGLVHSQVQEIMDQPVASMTTSLLIKLAELNLQRRLRAQQWLESGQLLSAYAREVYTNILEESQSCQVQVLGQDGNVWRAIVSQPLLEQQLQEDGTNAASFAVLVNTGTFQVECTCRYTEEMGIPCTHGTALLRSENLILGADAQWFHPRYHVTTLIQMYDCDPPDFSVFGKTAVDELIPPEHSNATHKTKRRKVSINNSATAPTGNSHKCAACGELGHHPKTCHQPSTEYRYTEYADKAMEWAKAALDLQL
jgi:hypothetical protein